VPVPEGFTETLELVVASTDELNVDVQLLEHAFHEHVLAAQSVVFQIPFRL
jgi:hypothetical protein